MVVADDHRRVEFENIAVPLGEIASNEQFFSSRLQQLGGDLCLVISRGNDIRMTNSSRMSSHVSYLSPCVPRHPHDEGFDQVFHVEELMVYYVPSTASACDQVPRLRVAGMVIVYSDELEADRLCDVELLTRASIPQSW